MWRSVFASRCDEADLILKHFPGILLPHGQPPVVVTSSCISHELSSCWAMMNIVVSMFFPAQTRKHKQGRQPDLVLFRKSWLTDSADQIVTAAWVGFTQRCRLSHSLTTDTSLSRRLFLQMYHKMVQSWSIRTEGPVPCIACCIHTCI